MKKLDLAGISPTEKLGLTESLLEGSVPLILKDWTALIVSYNDQDPEAYLVLKDEASTVVNRVYEALTTDKKVATITEGTEIIGIISLEKFRSLKVVTARD